MKRSLAAKLSFWICAILLTFFVVSAFLLASHAYTTLGKSLDEKAMTATSEMASKLNGIFLQTQSMAKLVADELESTPKTKTELPLFLKNRFRTIHAECPDVIGITIAYEPGMLDGRDEYNTFILLQKRGRKHLTCWNDKTIDYKKYLDWYLIPVQKKQIYWTSPFVAVNGSMIASCCVPFYRNGEGNGKIAGVVVLHYNIRNLVRYLWKINVPGGWKINCNSMTFMMNPFGKILASSRKEHILNETVFSLCEASPDPDPEDFRTARLIFGRGVHKENSQKSGKYLFNKALILNESCELFFKTCVNGWVVAVAVPSSWRGMILMPLFVKSLGVAIVIMLVVVITIFLICRHLNRPLGKLAAAAEAVGKGDFSAPLPEYRSNDEIACLAVSFRNMQLELTDYMKKLEESIIVREQTESELKAARSIQRDILPHILPPFACFDNVSSAADLVPAHGVGGDLYDVFPIDRDHLALIIGDVSGKGIPAALFMAVTQTLQRNIAASERSVSGLVNKLNSMLGANNDSSMFVTFWCGFLNIRNGHLSYVNGGHNRPLVKRTDGTVEELGERHGPPLGINPMKNFSSSEAYMGEGDMLICYTDGVTEATTAEREMFGEIRLRRELEGNNQNFPEGVLAAIKDSLADFTKGAEQFDDITILITQYHGEGKKHFRSKTFTAEASAFESVMEFVRGAYGFTGLNKKAAARLCMSVEEIFANIVYCVYGGKPGKLTVQSWLEDSTIRLCFMDSGKPCNPLENAVPDRTPSVTERDLGGSGISIVKKDSNFIEYRRENGKNVLTVGWKDTAS